MRTVLVNADSFIEHRRHLGMDKQDEMWEGEWHFVNAPKLWHPRLNSDMFFVLTPPRPCTGPRRLLRGHGHVRGCRD